MEGKTTFELTRPTNALREILKQRGAKLEYLSGGFWNVTVNDDEADDLTEFLDSTSVEYRLV